MLNPSPDPVAAPQRAAMTSAQQPFVYPLEREFVDAAGVRARTQQASNPLPVRHEPAHYP